MKAVDARTMQGIDASAVKDFGVKGLQLMENAGRAVSEAVKRELSACCSGAGRVAVITGRGKNGGDGFVCARHLKNSGIDVLVFSLARVGSLKGDTSVNARAWQKMGGEVSYILTKRDLDKHASALRHSSVIVDAIFGTGLSQTVEGVNAELIGLINGLGKKVIAVDMPSGIDATSGHVLGTAIRADVTITMALPKLGLLLHPGRAHAGRVEVADIGAPGVLLDDEKIRWNVTCPRLVRGLLRPREADTHKGTYGHVVVLSGSPGKTGAVYMAAMGAMRAGAGLVTIGLPESLSAVMETKTTEVMTMALPETVEKTLGVGSYETIKALLEGKSAVVIGPGLGVSTETSRLMEKVIRDSTVPLVIDADALNSLAGHLAILKESRSVAVLTPHPGEAARLLGVTTEEVSADRVGMAEKLSAETGKTVVLKGASTVIAEPGGGVYINPTGNAGLSSAGTGDVLSGMIGGLLAQGYCAVDSAVVAAYVHGLTADELKKRTGEAGMVATDLLPLIPQALNSLMRPCADDDHR